MWPIRLYIAVVLVSICASAHAGDDRVATVTDRAIQFVVNAYTGVRMEDSEWMTQEKLQDPGDHLVLIGGLRPLVESNARRAHEAGGLGSVEVVRVESRGDIYRVTARVSFASSRGASKKNQEKEEPWQLYFQEEAGKFKLPSQATLIAFRGGDKTNQK